MKRTQILTLTLATILSVPLLSHGQTHDGKIINLNGKSYLLDAIGKVEVDSNSSLEDIVILQEESNPGAEDTDASDDSRVVVHSDYATTRSFTFHPGSLKRNVERILDFFDHDISSWNFHDGQYEIDWVIREEYTVSLPNDIEATLLYLNDNFHLKPDISSSTKSVAFYKASGEIAYE